VQVSTSAEKAHRPNVARTFALSRSEQAAEKAHPPTRQFQSGPVPGAEARGGGGGPRGDPTDRYAYPGVASCWGEEDEDIDRHDSILSPPGARAQVGKAMSLDRERRRTVLTADQLSVRGMSRDPSGSSGGMGRSGSTSRQTDEPHHAVKMATIGPAWKSDGGAVADWPRSAGPAWLAPSAERSGAPRLPAAPAPTLAPRLSPPLAGGGGASCGSRSPPGAWATSRRGPLSTASSSQRPSRPVSGPAPVPAATPSPAPLVIAPCRAPRTSRARSREGRRRTGSDSSGDESEVSADRVPDYDADAEPRDGNTLALSRHALRSAALARRRGVVAPAPPGNESNLQRFLDTGGGDLPRSGAPHGRRNGRDGLSGVPGRAEGLPVSTCVGPCPPPGPN